MYTADCDTRHITPHGHASLFCRRHDLIGSAAAKVDRRQPLAAPVFGRNESDHAIVEADAQMSIVRRTNVPPDDQAPAPRKFVSRVRLHFDTDNRLDPPGAHMPLPVVTGPAVIAAGQFAASMAIELQDTAASIARMQLQEVRQGCVAAILDQADAERQGAIDWNAERESFAFQSKCPP